MSNSLASLSNRIRISGMASGMDTESMVKSLMQIEQMKVDKLLKAKTKLEWKNEALRDINNMIRGFRDKYMSALSPDTNMFTSSAYKVYKIEMESNPYVSISANTSARAGSYQIVEIASLAKPAIASNSTDVTTGEINTSMALKDLPLTTQLFADGETTITFSINGKDFEFNDTDTLQTMISRINNSGAGVTFSYSSLSDKFSITSKETGSDKTITIVNGTGNAFGENSAFGIKTVTPGEDAVVTINDGTGDYIVTKTSNSFTIDGITYNLKSKTEAGNKINFNISQDIDTPIKKIKDFISSYNELVKKLNDKIYEQKKYAYEPLTEAQKEELEPEEIEKWEAQAKSGLLRNDSNITRLLDEMRSMIYDKVQGLGMSLSDIGIKTGSYENRGQLVIDETKLRKMLSEKPDDVMKLFVATAPSTATEPSDKYNQSGLISRMTSAFSSYTGKVDFTKLAEDIMDYDDLIDTQEYKMYKKQEEYYKKFAALESALSKMYSQSSWLSQQMTQF